MIKNDGLDSAMPSFDKNPFTCNACGQRFRIWAALKEHRDNYCKRMPNIGGDELGKDLHRKSC